MADAANDLEEHGMVRTLKDLFAGAAGGIAQVLLGEFHSSPFPRITNRS
jgi:solute carrier family 25 carnitine/acylcarnitine transporter 20/29